MKVAIMQPNYIGWKGFFDMIASVDLFMVLDDVQYTRQDWRNRNKIKTASGTRWLTIPVHVNNLYEQTIRDTEVADPGWSGKHWQQITDAYKTAPFFHSHKLRLQYAYASLADEPMLTKINQTLIHMICWILDITTPIVNASDYNVEGKGSDRILGLCQAAGADTYLSGVAAKAYLDEPSFAQAGIELCYMHYDYPEYPQVHQPFEHKVSVIDVIFNTGDDALSHIKRNS